MSALVFFKLVTILALVSSLLCSSSGSTSNEKRRERPRADRAKTDRTARADRTKTDRVAAYKSQSMQKA